MRAITIRNTVMAVIVTIVVTSCAWFQANKTEICVQARNAITVGELALQTAGSKEEIIYWGSYIAGARLAVGVYCSGETAK